MKRTTKILISSVALGAVALLGVDALARGPGGWYGYGPGPGMMGMGPGMMGGGPMMSQGGPGAFQAQRLDAVKARLGLRPDQGAAWTAYEKALSETSEAHWERRANLDFGALQALSPQERFEFMQGMHEAHIGDLEAVTKARADLLAVLDETQAKTAATILPTGFGPGAGRGFGPMAGQGGCPRAGF